MEFGRAPSDSAVPRFGTGPSWRAIMTTVPSGKVTLAAPASLAALMMFKVVRPRGRDFTGLVVDDLSVMAQPGRSQSAASVGLPIADPTSTVGSHGLAHDTRLDRVWYCQRSASHRNSQAVNIRILI
jgi:hypothetical protein